MSTDNQGSEILSLRSKLDWCLPNITQCDKLIEESVDNFFNSSAHHKNPIASLSSVKNKIFERLESEECRLPFIIENN